MQGTPSIKDGQFAGNLKVKQSMLENQNQNVKWFRDYLILSRESSETIRCTPEMVKT